MTNHFEAFHYCLRFYWCHVMAKQCPY